MKWIILYLKRYLKRIITVNLKRKKFNINFRDETIYFFMAADYQNLCDIAIREAQTRYLKEKFPKYNLVAINMEDTYVYLKDIKKNISENSIIVLTGGGNNGSLYPEYEETRNFILKVFYKYKIISFPQTITYEQTKYAKNIQRLFIKKCKKCKDLTLIAREEMSYNIYKEMIPFDNVSVLLTPDIVFYLDDFHKKERKEEVIFLLRNDKEKFISSRLEGCIEDILKKSNNSYKKCDTISTSNDLSKYFEEFRLLLDSIASCKYAITDRLHGMIFCYITSTPCIVFNNNNNKIKSLYDTWLKKQNFIFLCDADVSNKELENIMKKICEIKEIKKENLKEYYEEIEKCIKS